MAPSPLRSITRKHARSVSLPSRSHPLVPQLDEHLSKVRALEANTTSTSSMTSRLTDLKNLYGSTDDILVLPHIQQAVSQECQEKWADELLDGYLRLLDACSSTRDFFSQIKQNIQDLLSALRRKDREDLADYLTSRRKSKKIIQKYLKELRSIRSRQSIVATEKHNESMAVLSLIKEVETITLTMFESFLFHLHGRKQLSGWSLVSKLMNATTWETAYLGRSTSIRGRNNLKIVDEIYKSIKSTTHQASINVLFALIEIMKMLPTTDRAKWNLGEFANESRVNLIKNLTIDSCTRDGFLIKVFIYKILDASSFSILKLLLSN